MAKTSQSCPKCNGHMEQGFVLDNTYGARVVSQWAAGAPQKSFWSGTKLPDEKLIPIGTFRCSSCGYLESYARQEFAAQ
jgi:predicted nucleic-acid-binding Zn-ribbon protein